MDNSSHPAHTFIKKTAEEMAQQLKMHFGEGVITSMPSPGTMPVMTVAVEHLPAVALYCQREPGLYLDMCHCITAIDNGVAAGTMEVIYNLESVLCGHELALKVIIPRPKEGEAPTAVPTVSHIWKGADWLEREVYDLFGIHFTNHPDLRRLLLPADWEGHPLLKDYVEAGEYHGWRVKGEKN